MSIQSVPKILVLDDEIDLVEILEFQLAQHQLSTVGFTDPLLAEEEILKGNIGVVFIDLNMPNRSGLEILRNARKKGIDTPFIFLTGSDDFKDPVDVRQLGAFAFLSKPFDISEIVSFVLKALESKKESP